MELTREAIMAAAKPRTATFGVDGIDGDFHVRSITGKGLEEWMDQVMKRQDANGRLLRVKGMMGWLVVRTLCDASGGLLFLETEEAEVMSIDANVLDKIFAESKKISGLETDIEETEKNLDAGPVVSRGSG